jgi:hypothetical protein
MLYLAEDGHDLKQPSSCSCNPRHVCTLPCSRTLPLPESGERIQGRGSVALRTEALSTSWDMVHLWVMKGWYCLLLEMVWRLVMRPMPYS